MTTQRLSFEKSPPLAVPLRFFLTGPLFGLLAAAALWPATFTYPAAFVAASSSVLLWWNLMQTLRVYRKFRDRLATSAALS